MMIYAGTYCEDKNIDASNCDNGGILWIATLNDFSLPLIHEAAPFCAELRPQQLRLWLSGAVPITCPPSMVFAIVWIKPTIFNGTPQNF